MAATCLYMNSILIEPKKPQNQFYPSLTQKPNVSFSIKLHEQSSSLMIKSPTIGLSETFSKLRRQGKVAFIPYITAGDPDLSTTAEALKLLNSCGSDIIELGLPYSNPWRDGPVNQAAAMRSLAKGADFNAIMSMLKRVIPQIYCPIVLLSYYNSILEIGTEKFMKTIKDVGVHGLLVPDIHLEETEILRKEALNNGIEFVLATSPNTPIEKMKTIVEASKGFIYLASSDGVTGARSTVNPQVPFLLQKIREVTTKPVAVGFGLSEPQHLTKVAGWGANGVIVGSAIVKLLGEAKSPMEGLEKLEIFIMSLKAALP